MDVKCAKHYKYRALRKPRVACEACWYLWAREHWFASIERSEVDQIKGLEPIDKGYGYGV